MKGLDGIGSLVGVSVISVGGIHSCASQTDGTAECRGYNAHGQFGNGTNTGPQSCFTYQFHGFVPCNKTPVRGERRRRRRTAGRGGRHQYRGESSSCALVADGTAECWGVAIDGQLGNGSLADSSTPVAVTGLSAGAVPSRSPVAATIRAPSLADGNGECWGANGNGQLGNGSRVNASTRSR